MDEGGALIPTSITESKIEDIRSWSHQDYLENDVINSIEDWERGCLNEPFRSLSLHSLTFLASEKIKKQEYIALSVLRCRAIRLEELNKSASYLVQLKIIRSKSIDEVLNETKLRLRQAKELK